MKQSKFSFNLPKVAPSRFFYDFFVCWHNTQSVHLLVVASQFHVANKKIVFVVGSDAIVVD